LRDLTRKLIELKKAVIEKKLDLSFIQKRLSTLLLSDEDLENRDSISKELDNDLELALYTLKSECQQNAAVDILNKAINLSKKK
tara:strand:- start:123 stop:374 length:252 start_codon:yes stop_codon:yes gene_type:complete